MPRASSSSPFPKIWAVGRREDPATGAGRSLRSPRTRQWLPIQAVASTFATPTARSSQQVSTGGRQCFSNPNPQTTCFCKRPVQPGDRRGITPPGAWARKQGDGDLPAEAAPTCLTACRGSDAGPACHGGTGRDTMSQGPEFPSWLTSALHHLQQGDPFSETQFPEVLQLPMPHKPVKSK